MNLESIPLFSMLRGKLGHLGQRQELIAQNVAHADTPGYAPRDLQTFTLEGHRNASRQGGGVSMIATRPGHIAPAQRVTNSWTPIEGADSETTLDGNKVVVEEQMIKMTEARMDYDAAIGFYEKSLGLLRMAARRPAG